MKRLRERYGGAQPATVGGHRSLLRYGVRIALLAAIAAIAFTRGYSTAQWLRVLVAVVAAAAMPLILTGVARYLRTLPSLAAWQRRSILFALGLVLIGGFIASVRALLGL